MLCPPFGWEDMCSYRVRREWAELLAADGHTTLRIDLPGSGDSAGSPKDPGQLDGWTRAVSEAARWLRQPASDRTTPVARVVAIGIGLGGLVACRAALQGAPIDELVLWAVPARGRTLVRELRSFSAFEVANILDAGDSAPEHDPSEEGMVVANGYMLSPETVRELEALDLAELEPAWRHARRALLLGRDGLKADKSLPAILERAGATVTVADGRGYGEMMLEPQDARVPSELIAYIGRWLAEGEEVGELPAPAEAMQSAAEAATAPQSEATPHATPQSEATPHAAPQGETTPHASETMELEWAGVALRETPLYLDGPHAGEQLFGILTEPLGERRELTGLLLNAGPQRRVGPNRMWVEIARRWAARGVPTLRLDADGIGDAGGDAGALGQVTAFYRPVYVEQTLSALQALVAHGLPPRFVLLGLCSGSYWASQAALADERVAAVMMLNPRTLVFDEWRHTVRRTRHLREQALMPSTWGRLLRGELHIAKHLETGRTIVRRAAGVPMRARARIATGRRRGSVAERPPHEPIEDIFDALRDRDQRALLVFTGKEVLRTELTQHGVLERIGNWPNLELALMGTSADTHTLTPLWLQHQAHALVELALERELERLPGAS